MSQPPSSPSIPLSSLLSLFLCPACHAPYQNARPYRSTHCDHSFCATCAAIARGNLGPQASSLITQRAGVCPVTHCKMPVRPIEIAEDVGLAPILDAAARLETLVDTYKKNAEKRANQ